MASTGRRLLQSGAASAHSAGSHDRRDLDRGRAVRQSSVRWRPSSGWVGRIVWIVGAVVTASATSCAMVGAALCCLERRSSREARFLVGSGGLYQLGGLIRRAIGRYAFNGRGGHRLAAAHSSCSGSLDNPSSSRNVVGVLDGRAYRSREGSSRRSTRRPDADARSRRRSTMAPSKD
jgi:hypothetical protein